MTDTCFPGYNLKFNYPTLYPPPTLVYKHDRGTGMRGSKAGQYISEFATELQRRIVGQPEAIDAIVKALKLRMTGMQSPDRPLANLLFAGPTGSGKTHVVETAADILSPGIGSIIKIDCAEFQHSHEIAKLIGAPPGYLGYRETSAILTQESLDRFHTNNMKVTFVLFDEVEKANDALWQLLLGVMDKATLKLGDNRVVDFSNCIIVMTSNLGAHEIAKAASAGIGFASQTSIAVRTVAIANAAVKKHFSPEFINRIDSTVVFHSLQPDHIRRILDLEMKAVQARIFTADCPIFNLEWTPAACDFLIANGISKQYGARELKRTIEKHVVSKITDILLDEGMENNDTLTVDAENGEIIMRYTSR